MKVILVADFGSSNVRVNAIDVADGSIIASHSVKYSVIDSIEGFAELDAEEEWLGSVQCVREVLHQLDRNVEILAISFSHIGSSLVPMDENFNASYHCILGMDSRAVEEARDLAQILAPYEPLHTSLTCTEMSTMAKTLYIKRKMPDVAAKTKYYLSIQQFILKKLGLDVVWDATEAGSHCCYDSVRGEWSQPVLDAVGIDRESLGKVVASHEIVGRIRFYGDVSLGYEVPVVIGGHDAVMGTIGLGIGDENSDAVAEVTGSVDVFCFNINRIFSFGKEELENARNGAVLMDEPGPVKNSTTCLVGYKTAGIVLEWFLREFCRDEKNPFDTLWEKISFDGSQRVVMNPNFVNGGGSVAGVDITTTRYDVFKACIEALTFEIRNLYENCSRLKTNEIKRVRVGGGHTSSEQWIQFRADVIGRPYETTVNKEVSALGSAILAAYGVGYYRSLDEAIAAMVEVKKQYEPNMDVHEKYECLYRKYLSSVQ